MKEKKNPLLLIFSFLFLVIVALVFPSSAKAASFSLEPLDETVKKGEEFQVKLILDTDDKKVNGIQAVLIYSSDFLEVKKVDFSNLFPSNFQSIDGDAGEIQLGSGEDLPAAYYKGKGDWLTLTFGAVEVGSSNLSFSCFESAILELETTVNLLDCGVLPRGSYTVTEKTEPPVTPTPTSVPVSSPSPTPTPVPACDVASPSAPTNLQATSGPENGEVTLNWSKVSEATHYNLVFGPGSRDYHYGAPNIGNTDRYVVRQLSPGQLYYFVVAAVNDCASSGYSSEVSARAKRTTSEKKVIGPTPTPAYRPIGEVLPNVAGPSPTPTPIALETLPPELEEEGEPSGFPFKWLIGLGILGTIAIFVTLRLITRRSSLPPKEPPPSPSSEESPSKM